MVARSSALETCCAHHRAAGSGAPRVGAPVCVRLSWRRIGDVPLARFVVVRAVLARLWLWRRVGWLLERIALCLDGGPAVLCVV